MLVNEMLFLNFYQVCVNVSITGSLHLGGIVYFQLNMWNGNRIGIGFVFFYLYRAESKSL